MTAADSNDVRAANLEVWSVSSTYVRRSINHSLAPASDATFASQDAQQYIVAVEVICEEAARQHELELLQGVTRERDERGHVGR